MERDDAIQKERIIELTIQKPDVNDFFYYSGICLKANYNIWLLINYDFDKNVFEGFTVFRNTDIEEYSVFAKKDLPKVDKTEFYTLKSAIRANECNTLYSSLKQASTFGLIAIFLKKDYDSYYVIKVLSVTKNHLEFYSVDVEGKLSKKKKTILLDDIFYFSFFTEYEKKLSKLIAN